MVPAPIRRNQCCREITAASPSTPPEVSCCAPRRPAAPGAARANRPYAFALLPDIDRLVVTSAPMMEESWADVVQIYRYSDFTLLHTIDLPPGHLDDCEAKTGSAT